MEEGTSFPEEEGEGTLFRGWGGPSTRETPFRISRGRRKEAFEGKGFSHQERGKKRGVPWEERGGGRGEEPLPFQGATYTQKEKKRPRSGEEKASDRETTTF